MGEILGIDIGGSGIKGAIVDLKAGTLVTERHRIPTPQPSTPKAVANTVNDIVQHFKWKGSIGCGFPGPIQNGVVKTAANVDDKWIDTHAEDLFYKKTKCPTKVINDADAAGVAEISFGAGAGVNGTILLITVGTGLGSALFRNGKLVPNTELGHLIFKEGKIAEWYASDAARKRNDLSWEAWAKRFDEVLTYIHKLCYPDLIIIGGGASKRFEKFGHIFTVPTKVVPAKSMNQAGIIGAAMAAKSLKKLQKV